MNYHILTCFLFTVSLFFITSCLMAEDRGGSSDKNIDIYFELSKRIGAFPVSRDVHAFAQLGVDIQNLKTGDFPSSVESKKDWDAKLDLWLDLVDKCSQMIDPKFDSKNVPLINIDPPADSGLSAGADPSTIKDEKLRLEYETAIRANITKTENYQIQIKLLKLESSWTSELIVFIRTGYVDKGKMDKKALELRLKGHISSAIKLDRIIEGVFQSIPPPTEVPSTK